MVVVGNLVGQIGDLGFKAGSLPAHETFADVAEHARILQRAMFEDAFAGFEGQIQAVKCTVTLLKDIDHAQRLQVMFESAIRLHADVQRVLTAVAKGRVAEIMRQCDGFGQVFTERQAARHGTADLRHFKTVRQPGAEQIAFMIHEHLGLVFQAAKSGGMDDAVAVALIFAAPARLRFAKTASARRFRMGGVAGQFSCHQHPLRQALSQALRWIRQR